MTSEPWSVTVVSFPFSDRRQSKRRPAVVLSPLDQSLILGRVGALAPRDRRAVARSLRSAIVR